MFFQTHYQSFSFGGLTCHVVRAPLKEFNKIAKSGSNYDLKSYLKVSNDGQEILNYLESSKHLPSEYAVIFETIEHILLGLVEDDPAVTEHIGMSIVRRILKSSLGTVYHMLNGNNKANVIKSALKLLTAMVASSAHAAQEVVAIFDFSLKSLAGLMNRRDIKDSHDIRTCYVFFLSALLMSNDNHVIKHVCQLKGFLNGVFPGLCSDKYIVIQVFLSTLQTKVLENTNISKTLKVKLLNDFTIAQIITLYQWTGPKRAKHVEKKISPAISAETASEEEKSAVYQTVQEFLLVTLSSHKYGVIFADKSYGTSGKNQNHIVSNILKLFDKPFKNPHIAALVINVLKSCPDQVMPYLVFLKSNILEPRASSNWVEAMNFFKQILEEQNTLKVLENETILTPLKLAEVIISLTLPVRIFTKEFISQCLIHDSFDVRKLIVDILLGALENISKIYKSGEKNEKLLEIISDILAKNLPEVSALISCWQLSNTLDEEQQFNSSTLEVFVNITKILSVYQTMLPGNFNSSSNDLCNLLISIEKTRENFVETEWLKLYLQILNLLSEGQNYKILLSQSVLKILIKTCLATNFELSESAVKVLLGIVEKSVGYSNVIRLITWLQVLRKTKSKDDLSEFFVEILLHAAEAESVANNSDEVSSSRCEGIHCALIENGFKILQVNKYSKKSYMSFLSSVVTAQIHFQPEPKIFCVFLSKYSEFMTEGLRVYIKVWTDGLNAVSGAKIKKLDQNATIQEQLQKILVNQSENFSSFVSCFKELQFSDEQILMEIANQISLYISVLQSCKDTRTNDLFDFLDIMFKTLNSEAQNVMYPIILRNINIKDNFSVTGSEISEKTQNSVLNIFECCAVCDSNILSFYSEKSKQLLINNLSSSIEPDYISLNNILRTFVNHFDNYSCLDIINSSKFSNMIKIDLVNLENLLTKCTRAISDDKVPKLASSFVRNFGDYISQVDDENIRRALLNILDALPIYAVIISKGMKRFISIFYSKLFFPIAFCFYT
ncbi:Nucleolar pre-ribosomal-associated protein 1 [Nymphon striatum]|nr:Nucleolar pre-ribosomal-associated protein 1 [Nymphon striatum]